MEKTRELLKARFSLGSTVPGTRSFHVFVPQGNGVIAFKRCAEDESFAEMHNFLSTSQNADIHPKKQDFVASLYDEHWWVGLVVDVDTESNDVLVKFMAPHGPSPSFKWPTRDDVCWVPGSAILRILQTPSTTSTGRSYKLQAVDCDELSYFS